MNRDLGRRLARLENRTTTDLRALRETWLPWRGRPLREWSEEAVEAFDRCSGEGDPVAEEAMNALTVDEVDWLLTRFGQRHPEVAALVEAATDGATYAEIVAMIEELRRCPAP